VLETERLVLRPIREDDLEHLLALWNDAEVMRYIGSGNVRTSKETEDRMQRLLSHWREHGFGYWALFSKADGCFAGSCGVAYLHGLADAELGYSVARRYWGQGLATEAAARVLRHAFEVLRLPRVLAVAQVGNVASQKVLLKLGMTFQRADQDEGREALLYAVENACAFPPAGQGA
jgi:ribosomal-protein-alanine N-acetyltransferase